jgi:hypothetical protein
MAENSDLETDVDGQVPRRSARQQKTDFEKAAESRPTSLIREFVQFLMEKKKWWLLPILLIVLACGLLMAFATTGAAPFIYTLF